MEQHSCRTAGPSALIFFVEPVRPSHRFKKAVVLDRSHRGRSRMHMQNDLPWHFDLNVLCVYIHTIEYILYRYHVFAIRIYIDPMLTEYTHTHIYIYIYIYTQFYIYIDINLH